MKQRIEPGVFFKAVEMKKYTYNTIGGLSLGLGMLGAFLPLLPTTCFILLASWAFAKSSPRFHNWLYYRSPFAVSIQNWEQYKIIPTRVKAIATFSIAISYSISVLIIDNLYVITGLTIGLAALLAYIFSKPGKIESTIYQQPPLLHLPIK